MGDDKMTPHNSKIPVSLYQWLLEQPAKEQEKVVKELFYNNILNVSDMIDLVNYETINSSEDNCPTIHSILWYGSIISQLETDSNWDPKGIYHYETTVGIVSDYGVWEIELLPGAWSSDSNTPSFNVELHRADKTHNVCIDTVSKKELPVGDRLATLVLACWNDEETAKIVDTFANAMGKPPPNTDPAIATCPNCGMLNNNFNYEIGHTMCECQRIYDCPTCDRMQFTEHGQCPSCVANYA